MELYSPSGDCLFRTLGKIFSVIYGCDQANQDVSGLTTLKTACIQAAEELVQRYALENHHPADSSLSQALQLLWADMKTAGYYVSASSRSIQIAPHAQNQGDFLLVLSDRNSAGMPTLLWPETIQLLITSTQDAVLIQSQQEILGTQQAWPGGSGLANIRWPITQPTDSLLSNAQLRAALDSYSLEQSNGWLVYTGQIPQTVSRTPVAVQRIAITGIGSGISGYFVLLWTDAKGRHWETRPIFVLPQVSYIQTLLREIPPLKNVVVQSVDTWTFQIAFYGIQGQPATFEVLNRLSGDGSPQVSVTVVEPGDSYSYEDHTLKLTGNGSEQTLLFQPISPPTGQVLAFSCRARRTPGASGTLRFQLRRGVQDDLLEDPAGNLNQIEIPIASIPSTSYGSITGAFRLKPKELLPVTFVIHLSTPLPADQSLYLDHLVLRPAQRMYSGGPYLAVIAGLWDGPQDQWTITCSNDYAGRWEKAFDQFLRFRQLTDLALPTSGSTLIPDNLIA